MLRHIVFGSFFAMACGGSSASMGEAGEDAGADAEEALCICDHDPPESLLIQADRVEDPIMISAGGEEKPVFTFRLWAPDWADKARFRCLDEVYIRMIGSQLMEHGSAARARLYQMRGGMSELLDGPLVTSFEVFRFSLARFPIGDAPVQFVVTLRTHPRSHGALTPRVDGVLSVCGSVDFDSEATRGTTVFVVSDR